MRVTAPSEAEAACRFASTALLVEAGPLHTWLMTDASHHEQQHETW